ncbi:hypothetical protein VM98_06430 [Streptomyces rubellomurinus subsp. indigoferus]|uniref:Uncharacterized protein n=1 Tax=Streptomyces rubellomurinus (strain ATCC 31215) TaxID=359131 RepID=A0A0F2TF32_STRR3|nr:fibronectin type III domain-containing protein [Streptomyces rubellomurinus]KJS56557.1 hypothetical protein VM98_06430 [Streptomyces rubellomurinus subsp. indigoferus]KJS60930.1 hypothetical protein VM95_18130 [Streptomyces rubellomurinus]
MDLASSRRALLADATDLGLGGAVSLSGLSAAPAAASPLLWQRPDGCGAPRVCGLHLQFGSDASREVVVSWHITASVDNTRVMCGRRTGPRARPRAGRPALIHRRRGVGHGSVHPPDAPPEAR